MFVMLCQGNVAHKFEEICYVSDIVNGALGQKRKSELQKLCKKWMKQFKKILGSQFVVSLQLGFSIGIIRRILRRYFKDDSLEVMISHLTYRPKYANLLTCP
jgi:hypothetical protein